MRTFVSLVVAAVLGLPAGAAAQQETGTKGTTPARVTAGQIAETPTAFFGRTVTVTAEVEEVFHPQIFTLDEDRVGASPDVLVLTPWHAGSMPEGEEVRVTGVVRPYVRTELERDYDWFKPTWSSDFELEISRRPVLLASSIVATDGRRLLMPLTETTAEQASRASGDASQPDPGRQTTDRSQAQRQAAGLPQTGTVAPLAGLVGLLSLGVGLAIRVLRS